METLLRGKQKFLAFVEKRVGSRAVAEDILQDAFVRSIERASELDGESQNDERTTAWFFRVLRNAVIDHYRHQAVEQRAHHEWAQDWTRGAELSADDHHEVCGCFTEFLGLLKPEYRRAIETIELGNVSLREFGEREGISANNAAVRVHRARQALRQHIERACSACAEHGCLDCDCRKLSDCK
jgi:RNA polymerase sigma-70 factor, ECF subfamily